MQRLNADEQIALLEKAQEVAHIGSWVADLDDSAQVFWSAETARILGVPADTAVTRAGAMIRFVHPDDRETVRRVRQAAMEVTSGYDVQHRIVRDDGTIRWVQTRADLVRDREGRPVRMVGTIQDITDRHLLEEQLLQSQKLEAIGRLAGGIAHDLNNSLTAIIGYAELAMRALPEDDPVRLDVQEVRRAAARAESVTRQVLAFSRKQVLESRTFSLSNAVDDLKSPIARLLGAEVAWTLEIEPELPLVHGDPGQISQAILNIAGNAKDAMPNGGRLSIALEAVDVTEEFSRSHQSMPPGRYVRLTISDTGHGMDQATLARVFEPFFTTKDVGKGTGLGLSMAYGTITQTGGYIFVESAVDRGTTFELYFPVAGEDSGDRERTSAEPEAAVQSATILVAEDEPPVRKLVATALRRKGYRVLDAGSGEEALRLAAAETAPIDLLLTDASMPGMSGLDLARALVARFPIPIVVMSGHSNDALQLGDLTSRVELLPKPFAPSDLQRKIADVLAARRRP